MVSEEPVLALDHPWSSNSTRPPAMVDRPQWKQNHRQIVQKYLHHRQNHQHLCPEKIQ